MTCRFAVVVAPVMFCCCYYDMSVCLNQHTTKARRSVAPAKHAGNSGEERLRVVDFIKELD